MKRSDLFLFLILQGVAFFWAGAAFALIPSRLYAGFAAGGYFIGSGAWMLRRASRWAHPWRSLAIYTLMIHLFVVSLPMVITRLYTADRAFESVQILGLPGPAFHRLSTTVFGALVAATVVDLLRTYRTTRSRTA